LFGRPTKVLSQAAMFDWNDLRYLLAIAREGSTLSAAKALGVSQPTVQRRLAALEDRIDRKLVEHHPTGYRLTELGKTLLPHAIEVERSVEAFQRQLMSEGEELTGTLRVTCPEGMASRLLAPVIEAFREKYPELRVDLIMTDRRLDLTKGKAEVALRMHEPGDDQLIARRIANSPWAIFASQSYIKRHGRPQRLEDLNQHAIIEFAGELADNHAAQWLQKVAPKARIAIRGNSMLGVLAAVKSGAGLAPLPMLLGTTEGGLEPVLESIPEIDTKLYLVMHADLQRTPRVRAFCDFVVAEIARLRPFIVGNAKPLALASVEKP
jgi:DNA-binding transcriptional LysR family regulator